VSDEAEVSAVVHAMIFMHLDKSAMNIYIMIMLKKIMMIPSQGSNIDPQSVRL
jgi:hypothetical protein